MSRLYGISERSLLNRIAWSEIACGVPNICSFCCLSYMYDRLQRSRGPRCCCVILVDPKNPPRHPSPLLRLALRGASIGPSKRASRRHNSTSHACIVFESTLSSCCSCTHPAHIHIDHDLSYDYDVRQTDLPKHAPSVTTPLYDDNPVGPPVIEPRNLDVDRGRSTGISETTKKNPTARIVRNRW
jgi:hypothetical protein